MIALALASFLAVAQATVAGSPLPIPPDAVVIRNSGSTNTRGYTVVVSPGGNARVLQDGTDTQKTLSPTQTQALFDDVHAMMPLAALPRRPCMRSASFGSSTTVAYDNAVTPDLACAVDPAGAKLRQKVGSIVHDLGITTLPQRMRL